MRDEEALVFYVNYIYHNSAKHGLVDNPFAWRWSSIHVYAKRGIIPEDWCGGYQYGAFGD